MGEMLEQLSELFDGTFDGGRQGWVLGADAVGEPGEPLPVGLWGARENVSRGRGIRFDPCGLGMVAEAVDEHHHG